MISIIICSRNNTISASQINNIENSIGLEYELIIIDNSQNKYSISQAYNEGIKRSQYPYLCFIHEDILFHTLNWGNILIKHFFDISIGMIGVAGTHFLPSIPTYWTTSPFLTSTHIQNVNGISYPENKFYYFGNKNIIDAVACDGMCLFFRKCIFQSISFDENTFQGFDFYDMDISMQVLTQNFRVCICKDIKVEHFSIGNFSPYFYATQELFYNKWKNYFPINRGIENIPQYIIENVNNLYAHVLDAQKARKSLSYKLGRSILKPFKFILRR